MTEDDNQKITAQINWPEDVYLDASPANAFLITEMNEMICMALGFVPLPPVPPTAERPEGGLSLVLDAKRITAFAVPRSMVTNLWIELGKFVQRNPELYGLVINDDGTASPA